MHSFHRTIMRSPCRQMLVGLLVVSLTLLGVPSSAMAEALGEVRSAAVDQVADAGADCAAADASPSEQAPTPDVGENETTEASDPTGAVPATAEAGSTTPSSASAAASGTGAGESVGAMAAASSPAAEDGVAPASGDASRAAASARSEAVVSQAETLASVTVTVRVVGPDATGVVSRWADDAVVTVPADYTAWEATVKALGERDLAYDASDSGWGVFLESITSPFTGRPVAAPADWSQYWQFFVGDAPADTGASSTPLVSGVTYTWYYGAWTSTLPAIASDGRISASLTVIGIDEEGEPQTWLATTTRRLEAGSTAAGLTQDVAATGALSIDCDPSGAWGWQLDAITSPFDATRTLGTDPVTWQYWQLFVNGVSSDLGAGSVTLADGDVVTWFYSLWGETPPADGDDGVEVDADAPRPRYDADWDAPQLGNVDGGAHVSAATPADGAAMAWARDLKGDAAYVSCSAPVIADGHVYVAVDNELRMVSAGDGTVSRVAALAAAVGINAPIAYADGLVVVPLLDGRVQALTADTLTTVWLANPFGLSSHGSYDPAPGLGIWGPYAYVTHFGTLTAEGRATGGSMACVSLATGDVRWVVRNAAGAGYYSDGITFVDGVGVATDDAGRVFSFDLVTGAELSALSVASGSTIRSAPVAGADGAVYVCAYDGTLHKLDVGATGAITQVASTSFGDASISAPTIVDGNVWVGGARGADGLIAVLNASTLAPLASATVPAGNVVSMRVQCAPLVATTEAGTHAYFTTYATPGGVYAWRLGDAQARALFTPADELANYCFYPVVADADGALYYLHDSYSLFKLVASAGGAGEGGAGAVTGGNDATGGATGGSGGTTAGRGTGTDTGSSGAGGASGAARGGGTSGRGSGVVATAGAAPGRTGARSASGARTGASSRAVTRRGEADEARGRGDGGTSEDGPGAAGDRDGSGHAERKGRARGAQRADDAGESKGNSTTAEAALAANAGRDAPADADTTGPQAVPPLAVAGLIGGLACAAALAWWLRRLLVTGK